MKEPFQTIRYQRQGDIGILTLARPDKRNAQNPLMWEELTQLGAELLPDETLRCLVVSGEGTTFSAGIDLVEGMAGLLADVSEHTDDESRLAVGLAVSGSFGWIPELGCASVAAVSRGRCQAGDRRGVAPGSAVPGWPSKRRSAASSPRTSRTPTRR
jgi:1,4-dihydroxy-2-naphthoyl-CoA synthase